MIASDPAKFVLALKYKVRICVGKLCLSKKRGLFRKVYLLEILETVEILEGSQS